MTSAETVLAAPRRLSKTETELPPLATLLRRAAQAAEARLANEICFMTPRQLTVLNALSVIEPKTQTELSAITGIDRSTMADMLRRLQRRGWIVRRLSRSDERAKQVTLTEAGARVRAKACELATAANKRLADESGFSRVDLMELEDSLERIAKVGGGEA